MSMVMKEEFQNTIEKLSGVIHATVITSDEGEIQEIHVLVNQTRHPKQVSRDVQSIYAAKYDEVIDRRLISIAQIEGEFDKREIGRIVVDEVKYHIESDSRAHVEVALKHNDLSHIGSVMGVHTSRNSKRLVIEATLKCVNSILDSTEKVIYEDFQSVRVAGKEVYNVALCTLNASNEEIHIGSAIVRGDERAALVRATLDAINRRITKLVN